MDAAGDMRAAPRSICGVEGERRNAGYSLWRAFFSGSAASLPPRHCARAQRGANGLEIAAYQVKTSAK